MHEDGAGASTAGATAAVDDEPTCAACAAAKAISTEASFGIEEGEVDQLEKKWITWCAAHPPMGHSTRPRPKRHNIGPGIFSLDLLIRHFSSH
jgi:hypothetical protein